ncbi:MAG: DMT family transporter [Phyllobacteriaceae bacterium]|nr:DMT family transporter [Phyllobacteriaceae bacterium]
MPGKAVNTNPWPWLAMIAAPAFFSTNLIFGRSLADEMDPFVLAFTRWALVALLLTPFVLRSAPEARAIVREHWRLLLALGFLGMWISGAIVYLALHHTSAINATLIYTTSPVMIVLIEALFYGRRIGLREIFGMAIAFCGVALIVLKGDIGALASLRLNPGDMMIALAALSWAAYSVLYRSPALKALPNLAVFGLVAWAGTLCLLPAVVWVALDGGAIVPAAAAWPRIAGLVLLSSLAAFGLFQFGVRALGASLTGIFMYMMPPYGVLMAIVFLGETLERFHIVGIIAVLSGIVLATFPVAMLKR